MSKDSSNKSTAWKITRRRFLYTSLSGAAGMICLPLTGFSVPGRRNPVTRFGIVTDSHYADIDDRGTRYYRETPEKMTECVSLMNDKEVDFVIHLGDFINGAPEGVMDNLRLIEDIYARFKGPRYHVLGNHDMDSISKEEFLSVIENTGIGPDKTWYSFDRYGLHFVVLDANFTEYGTPYDSGNFHWTDANIPQEQLDWLDADLSSNTSPAVICTHQLLDGDDENHYIRNSGEVRQVLETHPEVFLVFQGHQHAGQYNYISGIHYYTLIAMVEQSGEENNSYAIATVYDDKSVEITGFRRAVSKQI